MIPGTLRWPNSQTVKPSFSKRHWTLWTTVSSQSAFNLANYLT